MEQIKNIIKNIFKKQIDYVSIEEYDNINNFNTLITFQQTTREQNIRG